jgi:hypothetical protein
MPDRLLRLKRCHERIEPERLVFGMEEVGLTSVHAYPLLTGGPLSRRTSVAYVGFKREGS